MQRYLISIPLMVACDSAETTDLFRPMPTVDVLPFTMEDDHAVVSLSASTTATVSPAGVRIADGAHFLTLALAGVAPATPRAVAGDLPRIEQDHGDVTAWWIGRSDRLQQGWVVHSAQDTAVISLRVCAEDARFSGDAAPLTITGNEGGQWRYDKLVAWDADGTMLSSWMTAEGDCAALHVDAAQARYPVLIDPIIEAKTTNIVASDGTTNDWFGGDVSSAGDLDGDGYTDIVISAYGDSSKEGSAYIYYGTASGFDTASEVKLQASDGGGSDYYGDGNLDGGGDLNGDGYDDLIVGSRGNEKGAVYIYYGAATGLSASSEQRVEHSDPSWSDAFGANAVIAGDLNSDGYDDLAIASTGDDDVATDAGAVYIYYGSVSGIDTSTEQKLTTSDAAASDAIGEVSGAGDIDGDGYDDLLVGVENHNSDAGAVYIYYGSATGIVASSEEKLTASDSASDDQFGAAVAGGGDLNGDGYDDILIGADGDQDDGDNTGAAYVYYGSATGISTSSEEKITASDYDYRDYFGGEVALIGDIDGDGYGEIAMGASSRNNYWGGVYIYYGSVSGIDTTSELILQESSGTTRYGSAVAGLGDIDGDGADDFLVGNIKANGTQTAEGAAWLHYGDVDADKDTVGASVDCDDNDSTVGEVYTQYADTDGDGYGDASSPAEVCPSTSGYVENDDDCDDTDGTIFPGSTEVCDGADNDCDGTTDEDDADDALSWFEDSDSDGYGDAADTTDACYQPSGYVSDDTDCDDNDSSSYPGATETCDDADNDCDGTVDEDDAADAATWYADSDGDGYGEVGTTDVGCEAPSGFVADATDCDDLTASTNPGATEHCDGSDNDCDGTTDEDDADDAATWYADSDADGFGDAEDTTPACEEPSGYVADATDCDDANNTVNPDADEECDSIDNDCDGTTDEDDAIDAALWYADSDSDDFGALATETPSCSQPSGYVSDSTDCDDSNNTVNPDADEECDSVDNDCDGTTDEDDAIDARTWYADDDGDGYGNADVTTPACEEPSGYLADSTDCNDTDASAYPGGTETADGVDDDCDGTVDEGTSAYDDDGDGYTEDGGDCDDADAAINPAAAEIADGIDSDCDGTIDEGTDAYDDDGDGITEDGGDCNDHNADIHPGASDIDNGIDDDCDGVIDTGIFDGDGDGYLPEGGDCDDDSSTVWPGADELEDGIDNDCDGTIDEGTDAYDDDGDGFTELEGDCSDSDDTVHPEALDGADGIDSDCDGTVDEDADTYDGDGDGFSDWSGDCDDASAAAYPGATELEDGADNDCDGLIDEGTNSYDDDGDGATEDDGDCDDDDGWVYPGATELCDGTDNDCNGDIDDACGEVEDTGETTAPSGGCTTAPSSPSGSLAWLGLVGLIGIARRRRSALLAGGLLASGCGGGIETNLDMNARHLSADPVDLSAIPVGTTIAVPVLLEATGEGMVTIDTISIDEVGGFTLTGWPETLSAGESAELELTYTPTETGWHRAGLTVSSNAIEETFSIEVRAEAVETLAQVWPTRIDFGAVEVGASSSEDITVRNNGALPLEIGDWSLSGAAFALEDTELSLAPGAEQTLTVRFSPEDELQTTDTLAMTLSGVDFAIELLGNACGDGEPELYDTDGDGYTTCAGDCDDSDTNIYPGAVDLEDGEDNDCDGTIDEGTNSYDDDGDGTTEDDGDCNDGDASASPDLPEIADNGVDDDCDGVVDDGTYDRDGDGYTVTGGDCDNSDGTVYPGGVELEDGVDNDCDGTIDEGTSSYDDDADGYTEAGGDCDDDDAASYPGATERSDWIDNDCDGVVDEGTDAYDDDGDGFTEDGGDCDDGDSDVSPAELEVTGDGVDNDCDGTTE